MRIIGTGADLEAGGVATLPPTAPASARGEWPMGRLVPGHDESGMRGTIRIE